MYTSPWINCEHEYNIGQSERQFGVRLKEHERAVLCIRVVLCIKIIKVCRNMLARPTMKLGGI